MNARMDHLRHCNDSLLSPEEKELITTAFQRLPLQENHMEIQAIIESIKDETDEQVEQGGVNCIPNRIVELHGMIEVLQILDSVPAILFGAILAMQEALELKYVNGVDRAKVYY